MNVKVKAYGNSSNRAKLKDNCKDLTEGKGKNRALAKGGDRATGPCPPSFHPNFCG